jgi:prevent-host-death family protein
MASVTAFEAKTRFGELLKRVSRGEEIVITRHEKAVARIVPEGHRSLEEIRSAVAGLRSLHKRIADRQGRKPKLTQRQIKTLIEEGRR